MSDSLMPPTEEEISAAREILALGPGADRAEIMSAWRIAARMTHPDTVSPDAVDIATRMSQRVNEARDLLLSLLPTEFVDVEPPSAEDIDLERAAQERAAQARAAAAPPTTPADGAMSTTAPTTPGYGTPPSTPPSTPSSTPPAGGAPPRPDAAAPPKPSAGQPPPIPVDDTPRAPIPGAAPGSVFGRQSPSASRPSAPRFAAPDDGVPGGTAPTATGAPGGDPNMPPPPPPAAPSMPRGLHTVVGGTTEIDQAMTSSAGLPQPRPIRTTTRQDTGAADTQTTAQPVAGAVAPDAAAFAPPGAAAPVAPVAAPGGAPVGAPGGPVVTAPADVQPTIDPEVLAAAAARRAAPQRPAARPGAEVRQIDRKEQARRRAEAKKAEQEKKRKKKGVQFDEDGKPILSKPSSLNSTTALMIIVILLGGGVLAWQYGLLDQYLPGKPDNPVLAAVEKGEVVADPAAAPVPAPDPASAVGLAVSAVSVGDPQLLAGVVTADVPKEQLAAIVEAFVPAADDQELPAAVKAQLTCTDPAQPNATCTIPPASGIELAEPIALVSTPQGWRISGLAVP